VRGINKTTKYKTNGKNWRAYGEYVREKGRREREREKVE
jgi:predicted component of type VI protein secretion system